MEAAQEIRRAVEEVSLLRQNHSRDEGLGAAVRAIKRFQGLRFQGTYADILSAGPYAQAARFFLDELYGDKDYASRDEQFARIAGAIERLFPEDVAQTAVSLARLHALTERLDHGMALRWLDGEAAALGEVERYVRAWKDVGSCEDRVAQLAAVLALGRELARLTRLPGLRLMLKMMRAPASAAGLSALQRFLETGFDTFAAMGRERGGPERFLGLIEAREQALIDALFAQDDVACGTTLRGILGQAR